METDSVRPHEAGRSFPWPRARLFRRGAVRGCRRVKGIRAAKRTVQHVFEQALLAALNLGQCSVGRHSGELMECGHANLTRFNPGLAIQQRLQSL